MPEWSPSGCGPAPVSSMSGGGEVVSVHQEGDELAIAGGGRVFRTNQCYDQQPTLAPDLAQDGVEAASPNISHSEV